MLLLSFLGAAGLLQPSPLPLGGGHVDLYRAEGLGLQPSLLPLGGTRVAHVTRHRLPPPHACDGLDAILAELDEDEDEADADLYDLSSSELALAAELEAALRADMLRRAVDEQLYLGKGVPLPLSPTDDAAQRLAADGVVRMGGCLSGETAGALRLYVVGELEKARAEAARAHALSLAAYDALGVEIATSDGVESSGRFSKVLAPEGSDASQEGSSPANAARWDLRLSLDEPLVRTALHELYGAGCAHGETLAVNAGGDEAELWELAALISSPGAVAQLVHADTTYADGPILHTSFVALQHISRALGPTRFLPGTHADERAHRAHAASADGLTPSVFETPPTSYVALLERGDAAVYDGRLFHCGGANTANRVSEEEGSDGLRILFYATFRHADRLDDEEAGDDPARRSILSDLAGRHTLRSLRKAVQPEGV